MQFFVGTSGYSHKEWKGKFYPEKLPQKDMLPFYAERFSTVEINSSFYALPSAETVESWIAQTPETFRFAMKAPQSITHRKRLNNAEAETDQFLALASLMKKRQAPLLFQLPPNFKKNLERLDAFLTFVNKRAPIAFEFRHETWFDAETFDCLRAHACTLCLADTDDAPCTELVTTTSWGYVRLRRTSYTDQEINDWVKRLTAQKWKETYVYFMHEETASGIQYAARFVELAARPAPRRKA